MTRICEACGVFIGNCNVPVGDGCVWGCWLCAHYITAHSMPVGPIPESLKCSCTREVILPIEYRGKLDRALAFLKGRSYASASEAIAAAESANDPNTADVSDGKKYRSNYQRRQERASAAAPSRMSMRLTR